MGQALQRRGRHGQARFKVVHCVIVITRLGWLFATAMLYVQYIHVLISFIACMLGFSGLSLGSCLSISFIRKLWFTAIEERHQVQTLRWEFYRLWGLLRRRNRVESLFLVQKQLICSLLIGNNNPAF